MAFPQKHPLTPLAAEARVSWLSPVQRQLFRQYLFIPNTIIGNGEGAHEGVFGGAEKAVEGAAFEAAGAIHALPLGAACIPAIWKIPNFQPRIEVVIFIDIFVAKASKKVAEFVQEHQVIIG